MKIMKGGRGTVGSELPKPAAKPLKVATVAVVGLFSKPVHDTHPFCTTHPAPHRAREKSSLVTPTSPTRSYFQRVSPAFAHPRPYRAPRGNHA